MAWSDVRRDVTSWRVVACLGAALVGSMAAGDAVAQRTSPAAAPSGVAGPKTVATAIPPAPGQTATPPAAGAAPAAAEVVAPPPPPQPATPLALAIESRLVPSHRQVSADVGTEITEAELVAARSFYTARGSEPLWVTERGLTPRAKSLMAELRRADDWGLRSTDFQVPAADAADRSLEALSRAEIALTATALKYARHARGGRIAKPEETLSGFIDRRPQDIAPAKVLEELANVADADAYLRGLHPRHPQFQLLRKAYLDLQAEQGARASTTLPSGPELRMGDDHPHVEILRRRLDVAAVDFQSAEVFDPALVGAVKAFQRSAGLRADGIVGERTRRELNGASSSSGKIERLLANMEQWRWMPAKLGDTRIEVNVPEQSVRFVRNGQTVHVERVIVGKMETATPIFSDEMETVVFQPKWGVPDSIKVNKYLPRLRSGGGLPGGFKLMKGPTEIDPYDVDWNRADITKYQIYQTSGDHNALGQVKFLFPNKHAVYLHDTPTKGLFNSETRMYSAGCVRVRNPIRLAELILDTDKGWPSSHIRDLVENGPDDNVVRLGAKIPVHINHFTAVADETTGAVRYLPDTYGHEKRIALALQGRFDRIVKLDPKPVEIPPAYQVAGRAQVRVNGKYPPPSALGFRQSPQPPSWFNAPPPPPPPAARSRGRDTPNEIFRRAFGQDF